jgi:hypothetical protein
MTSQNFLFCPQTMNQIYVSRTFLEQMMQEVPLQGMENILFPVSETVSCCLVSYCLIKPLPHHILHGKSKV